MGAKRLVAVFAALAGMLIAGSSSADVFPSRPIRFVVPFPPGGFTDILARTLTQPLTQAMGQPVIVENRPGGAQIIGAQAVLQAPPDGHALLFMGAGFVISPAVRALPYDTLKDFAPVARIAAEPLAISVNPSVPASTLSELIALARAKPDILRYATGGAGTVHHLAAHMLSLRAGASFLHVPFQGAAPAVTSVVGGHTDVLFINVSETLPHAASGKLRTLAVTSSTRHPLLKNVPTVSESGYATYEVTNWFGVLARSGTPASTITRLSGHILRAVELPEMKELLDKQGLTQASMGSAAFEMFFRAEVEKYGMVARNAGMKAD